MNKPRVAVHKFSSCDGCQLAFLNAGPALLTLAERVELVHFAEAGPVEETAEVDVAFVEGSIATHHDLERIQAVRRNSGYVIALGACATSGGIQALRNTADLADWQAAIYAQPEHIDSLERSESIAAHIEVDFHIWGCPVNPAQVFAVLDDLLAGTTPRLPGGAVCHECKRAGHRCVLVHDRQPCLGPVTRCGCGALCPSLERACYGCFGPTAEANESALADQFVAQGLSPAQARQRLNFIHAGAGGAQP